ncbi:hypothetical protein KZZ52_29445 [Dactylosporangium sp. AC04546]|uniref:hypothetical protein n=1 Tax=Dactylosporangium sp. AC04546 TaxID=2862460 RepID=UPI001EE13333|nr:hypothetical protein [Dactylosporangium sp. AC04546]WVK89389.1 hypothetical protein KZZ52_29445 [Dactylosporangium sp. AC04546]
MMRNTQRILALAGMTLAAGAVLGMNAAAASAATTQAERTTVAKPGPHDNGPNNGPGNNAGRHRGGGDRHWTVGYFPNKKSCTWAGKIGVWHGDFDDYDCYRINRKGTNVLVAHDYRRHGGHR